MGHLLWTCYCVQERVHNWQMPALIEHGHSLGVLVIFAPEDLQSIPNVYVIVHAEHALNCVVCLLCCYIIVCIWSTLWSQRQISTSVDDKLLFFLSACVFVPECLSVCVTALPVKDKCMRQWKQIWLGIKIDAERDGWLLALNTEALTFFHLCYIHSVSLTLFIQLNFTAACSYWPLATAEGRHNWP